MKRKTAKADDYYYEPAPILGVGAYISSQAFPPDKRVKDLRVVGFVRPKPVPRKDAKTRRR